MHRVGGGCDGGGNDEVEDEYRMLRKGDAGHVHDRNKDHDDENEIDRWWVA